MSTRNLEFLFQPKSLAVIGATDRPGAVGATVMRNVLEAGFAGPVWPVNPKHRTVAGRFAWPDVGTLPEAPDAAIVCTPARTVPGIIAALAARGTRAAIVLTGGLSGELTADGRPLTAAMLDAARPGLLRVLGPNCVGLIVPGMKLNASFAQAQALPGKLAFVTQSGALATAMLDWTAARGIGFSHFVSLGDGADVDFGDVLNHLGGDSDTRAILLYVESIKSARKFMSAARAAARNKPIIAVKAGRAPEGARAASSHTGALAGSDAVYDAALARAGILRVATTKELFGAAETLARARPLPGNRLVILTNGGGPGVMATDALVAGGGFLGALSDITLSELNRLLPAAWSHGNPVDIGEEAPAERYAAALRTLLAAAEVDAVLFIHAPTAIVPALEIAGACASLVAETRKNVFACWLGGESVREADALFSAAGAPTYATPEDAVEGFLQIVRHGRNRELLMQAPPSTPEQFVPDVGMARRVIEDALMAGRTLLADPDARRLVAAYGIPTADTRTARTPEEAAQMARELEFPVALKILSPDLGHKSDVGGVALNLCSVEAVREAAAAMLARCAALRPDAQLTGFIVQHMASRAGARELIVGASTDPVFGPVILFGHGGIAVEVTGDRAVALPPLNLALAHDLVSRTRVAKLLEPYRDQPAADRGAIHLALVKISQLVADLPEVVELEINPLIADAGGVLALDVRARLARAAAPGSERLAIRPYPEELEEWAEFGSRRVLMRPIRPEDEPQHGELLSRITADDIRYRFFLPKRQFDHTELASFTQIDYDRDMAFIATAPNGQGAPETLGVARAMADPDNTRAEFAVLVRSDLKGGGLGRALLEKIIRYCASRGTRELFGDVLAGNARMLRLVERLGFSLQAAPHDPGVVRATLELPR